MNPSFSRIMVALSILYGISIPIMAILEVPNLWKIAAIGAIVLGGAWALSGVFGGSRSRRTE